jgi:hypothetical protein
MSNITIALFRRPALPTLILGASGRDPCQIFTGDLHTCAIKHGEDMSNHNTLIFFFFHHIINSARCHDSFLFLFIFQEKKGN